MDCILFLQEAFPARFKGAHLFRQPWYVSLVFNIVRPFLKQKFKERVSKMICILLYKSMHTIVLFVLHVLINKSMVTLYLYDSVSRSTCMVGTRSPYRRSLILNSFLKSLEEAKINYHKIT